MRFITPISAKDLEELKNLFKKSENSRIRMRTHAIILNSRNFTIDQIAEIYQVDRDSVSSWLNRWEEYGIEGLSDLPKSGRPPVIFDDLKKNFKITER